jgi:hypothetical protein
MWPDRGKKLYFATMQLKVVFYVSKITQRCVRFQKRHKWRRHSKQDAGIHAENQWLPRIRHVSDSRQISAVLAR